MKTHETNNIPHETKLILDSCPKAPRSLRVLGEKSSKAGDSEHEVAPFCVKHDTRLHPH